MGPVNTETIQTSSVMESEHETTTSGDLRMHSPTAVDGVHLFTSGTKLSSSSSSSSSSSPGSPLEDPFKEEDDEPDNPTPSTSCLPKLDEDAQLASEYGEQDVSGSSMSKHEKSNHEVSVSTSQPAVITHTPELSSENAPTTESPPTQVMERSGYPSNYRIPSSVFARTKSTTPVEWSVASNDSLFSIHMGNMSFTKDYFPWRSGELGMPGEPSTSGQMFNFSANQPPVSKATDGKSHELGVAEAAVETMKEVLRESAENQINEKLNHSNEKLSLAEGRISRGSKESGTSTKSFAFQVSAGDTEKGGSVNVGLEQKQPQPLLKSQQQVAQPEPKAPAATPWAAQTRWFSCWSCSSFSCC